MPTWRGILKDVERATKRQIRENEQRAKHEAKNSALDNAKTAVNTYNEIIDRVTSIHKYCCNPINWDFIIKQAPPNEIKRENHHEQRAMEEKSRFKPSIINKSFHTTNKRLERLDNKVQEAKNKDEDEYQKELKIYKEELNKWENNRHIASEILNKEPNAIQNAICSKITIDEDVYIGFSVKKPTNEDAKLIIEMEAYPLDDIIPEFELKLLKSGNLSKNDMPKAKRLSIYRDYISSLTIRFTREVFAILPINEVILNVKCKTLNEKTGYIKDAIILSIFLPRESLEMLNFFLINPSLALDNFKHNINFSKSSGFVPVSQVSIK